MVYFVSIKPGQKKEMVYSFCENKYLEETYCRKISLGKQLIFHENLHMQIKGRVETPVLIRATTLKKLSYNHCP